MIDYLLRNIGTLAQVYTVYAIDLIGFGASEKPVGFSYTMEKWAEVNALRVSESYLFHYKIKIQYLLI